MEEPYGSITTTADLELKLKSCVQIILIPNKTTEENVTKRSEQNYNKQRNGILPSRVNMLPNGNT